MDMRTNGAAGSIISQRRLVAADDWRKLEALARTNATAAAAVGMLKLGRPEDDARALLRCLVAALESNELLLERARNLIALMPPAPIVAGAAAPATREVAPWPDYAGNPIHEGDSLQHPASGEVGVVFVRRDELDPILRWRVRYEPEDRGGFHLCLQVDDKGQAVVVPQ